MSYAVTQSRVVRAEWTKLRTLRSTWITLVVGGAVAVGLAGAFGHGYHGAIEAGEEQASVSGAIGATFLGLDLLALVLGVLGVLQVSGEYGSGAIRASLTAVPRRWPLLAAKATVLAAVTAPFALVVCFASVVVARAFLGDDGASLSDDGVVRAIAGAAAYPVATALIGLGFGAAMRHAAPAITLFMVTFLLLPAMLPAALSESLEDRTLKYTPIAAAQSLYSLGPDGGPVELLSPGAGVAVLAAWVAAILAAGVAVLVRRDT